MKLIDHFGEHNIPIMKRVEGGIAFLWGISSLGDINFLYAPLFIYDRRGSIITIDFLKNHKLTLWKWGIRLEKGAFQLYE
jgi:hypothetical protein